MIGEGFAGIGAFSREASEEEEDVSSNRTEDIKKTLLEKRLARKGQLAILKQDHVETISKFF